MYLNLYLLFAWVIFLFTAINLFAFVVWCCSFFDIIVI